MIHLLSEELPHSIAVKVEKLTISRYGSYYISAIILVARGSQKKIVIGHRGDRIKKIGVISRNSIEEFLKAKVYLDLYVKVQLDWMNDERILKDLGHCSL
jgi:GTP-binding protein Era